jgi:hypothetical protein
MPVQSLPVDMVFETNNARKGKGKGKAIPGQAMRVLRG